jgi:23S rRNA pseudouridine1911/1915/1917 synthase
MSFTPKIIYQDDYFLAIDKPSGVVVNDSDSANELETVQAWVKTEFFGKIERKKYEKNVQSEFFERSGIIHRIDKETSGVLLIAKNEMFFEKMQSLFKERKINKKYICLVHGTTQNHELINLPLKRHPNKGKFIVDENGKSALTEYVLKDKYIFNEKTLNEFQKKNYERLKKKFDIDTFSRLDVKIYTGRTHQIRVHLSHLGHPVVGDDLYGFRKLMKFERDWCPRQFLHAAELKFDHPVTGTHIELESPMPDDLKEILKKYLIIKN